MLCLNNCKTLWRGQTAPFFFSRTVSQHKKEVVSCSVVKHDYILNIPKAEAGELQFEVNPTWATYETLFLKRKKERERGRGKDTETGVLVPDL